MLSTITIECRLTRDTELRTTASGVLFTRLDVAVNKGYGEKEHPNYYQCFLRGDAAERICKAGVKKGSHLLISGDLDIGTYTRKDGTVGISNNIDVHTWTYVSSGKPKTDENGAAASTAPATQPVQGYNPYANVPAPQFEEIGDDEELPF